jgi:atypical dual specificity phosphatase
VREPDFSWIIDGQLAACRYPRGAESYRWLAEAGVRVLINLEPRAHWPADLERHGLRQVHLPVADFAAPTPQQLTRGVGEIRDALAGGDAVAVHCAAGLGRAGTLVACYLVSTGMSAADAITFVRGRRPGSVETGEQVHAVEAFAAERA